MHDYQQHPGWFRRCRSTLSEEFQREKFHLTHAPADDFCKSQWQRGRKNIAWLIYRLLLAIFFTAGVVSTMIVQWWSGRWWIYLTDWGFLLCMCTTILGAIITTIYYFNPNGFEVGNPLLKIYWFMHSTALVLALLITLVFWSVLYPKLNVNGGSIYNLWAHLFNSVLMLLDLFLVAFPIRLLHIIYPIIFGLVYVCFSFIYYITGGTDIFDNRYIYFILDWSRPSIIPLTLILTLVLLCIFKLIIFVIYKVRVSLHSLCYQRTTQMQPA